MDASSEVHANTRRKRQLGPVGREKSLMMIELYVSPPCVLDIFLHKRDKLWLFQGQTWGRWIKLNPASRQISVHLRDLGHLIQHVCVIVPGNTWFWFRYVKRLQQAMIKPIIQREKQLLVRSWTPKTLRVTYDRVRRLEKTSERRSGSSVKLETQRTDILLHLCWINISSF